MSLRIFYHPYYSSLTLPERHRFPLAKYQALYPEGHPYRAAVIGSHADIQRIQLGEIAVALQDNPFGQSMQPVIEAIIEMAEHAAKEPFASYATEASRSTTATSLPMAKALPSFFSLSPGTKSQER